MNLSEALSSALLLVVQIAAILVVTLACGSLLKRFGQPSVVGEIAGGLLLGPLALSHLFPATLGVLFSSSKLHPLELVSNAGLVLFLFVMGTELNLDSLRKDAHAALPITVGSIALPFALGSALGWFLYDPWAAPAAARLSFTLFLGIAMSITAMPVLARILQDRKASGRAIEPLVGTLAMLCAAANDLLGWCLLAVTLAIHHGTDGATISLVRLLWVPVYLGAMYCVVRPLAHKLFRSPADSWISVWFPSVIVLAFSSARITELLGIHAFVGAFVAGICVSGAMQTRVDGSEPPLEKMRRVLRPILWVALPVFFAMTGLRMQRNVFSSSGMGWLGIIVLLAVIGKIGGGALGAWAGRMPWQQFLRIGVLLNTRGLVELIVLNVGYKEGILSPALFTLFVLMAVLTTVMTSPLYDLSYKLSATNDLS